MNLIKVCGVVVLCGAMFAVAASGQCPNVVGQWTGTFNNVCTQDGYYNGIVMPILITDQQGCLFRGLAIDSEGTNAFTGAIQIFSGLPTNIVLSTNGGVGLGKLTGDAQKVRNLVVQDPDSSNPCISQGKMEKGGPLP